MNSGVMLRAVVLGVYTLAASATAASAQGAGIKFGPTLPRSAATP